MENNVMRGEILASFPLVVSNIVDTKESLMFMLKDKDFVIVEFALGYVCLRKADKSETNLCKENKFGDEIMELINQGEICT